MAIPFFHLYKRINALWTKPALLTLVLFATPVSAETATIAVATNFRTTLEKLVNPFEQQSSHQLVIVSAATGVLFNQIKHGAPFDVLLAADQQHPIELELLDLAIPNSRFTYAIGRLALAFNPSSTDNTLKHLQLTERDKIISALQQSQGKIAIANPSTAPYGLAAQQSLESLNLWPELQQQIVVGTNVAQSYQFVATGNADLGLVALSHAQASVKSSSQVPFWPIPASWHQPIQQQAILLQSASDNSAAKAFLAFLKKPEALFIIQSHGYSTPSQGD